MTRSWEKIFFPYFNPVSTVARGSEGWCVTGDTGTGNWMLLTLLFSQSGCSPSTPLIYGVLGCKWDVVAAPWGGNWSCTIIGSIVCFANSELCNKPAFIYRSFTFMSDNFTYFLSIILSTGLISVQLTLSLGISLTNVQLVIGWFSFSASRALLPFVHTVLPIVFSTGELRSR